MKTIKTMIVLLTAIFYSISSAQTNETAKEWKNFKNDFEGKKVIIWNKKTGGAKRIVGTNIILSNQKITKQNVENVTTSFLNRYNRLFNIKGTEARLKELELTKDKYVLTFQQYYKDIPVLGAKIKIMVNQKGQINYISSGFNNVQQDVSIAPKISLQNAITLAMDELSINDSETEIVDDNLVIYSNNETGLLHLCWKFRINCREKNLYKIILIDSNTGTFLSIYDAYKNYDYLNGSVKILVWPHFTESKTSEVPTSEMPCKDLQIKIDNYAWISYTDNNGNYSFYLPEGQHTIDSWMFSQHVQVFNCDDNCSPGCSIVLQVKSSFFVQKNF